MAMEAVVLGVGVVDVLGVGVVDVLAVGVGVSEGCGPREI